VRHDESRFVPRVIPLLDGVRGLAIALVMLFHFSILMHPDGTAERIWMGLARMGWSGVDLFFVLSGHLITGILLQTRGSPGYYRSFYARRALRIFPLYYAVVFVSLVILPRIDHPEVRSIGSVAGDELWYWAYLSNWKLAQAGRFRHAILDISWSLSIEEQFYLVWPLVVSLCRRRGLLVLCPLLMAGALGLRMTLLSRGAAPLTAYVLTPCRIDALAAGALLAAMLATEKGRLRARRLALPVLVGAAMVLGVVILLQGGNQYGPLMQRGGYSALALLFAAGLAVLLTGSPASPGARLLAGRWLRVLGRLSYGLYLVHLPLRSFLRALIGGAEGLPVLLGSRLPALVVFMAACTVGSLGVAWLSFKVLEAPFLALKRFFPRPS